MPKMMSRSIQTIATIA